MGGYCFLYVLEFKILDEWKRVREVVGDMWMESKICFMIVI